MHVRVGINGMGNIGRDLLRIATDRSAAGDTGFEVVAVNDLAQPETVAHLLKPDSTYGAWSRSVEAARGLLDVDGRALRILQQPDPEDLRGAISASTSSWRRPASSAPAPPRRPPACGRPEDRHHRARHRRRRHHRHGHQPRRLREPAARRDLQRLVHHQLRGADGPGRGRLLRHRVGASHHRAQLHRPTRTYWTARTRTCAAPVRPGQRHPDQHRRREGHRPRVATAGRAARRGGRAGAGRRRLAGRPHRPARRARHRRPGQRRLPGRRRRQLKGILRCTDEPVVSHDVIGEPESCLLDTGLTRVAGQMVKVFGWYDNEWGYAQRTVDLVEMVTRRLPTP